MKNEITEKDVMDAFWNEIEGSEDEYSIHNYSGQEIHNYLAEIKTNFFRKGVEFTLKYVKEKEMVTK